MEIQALPTPNPNSLKFVADGQTFLDGGLLAFHSAQEAEDDALGAELFALRGVESVLAVPDFVTVTKHPAADWDLLAEGITLVLQQHLAGRAG